MPPALAPPDEDDYDSAADSDFNDSLSPSSGDESETGTTEKGFKNRKQSHQDADGDVELGSGDEGIIAQAKRRRRRKGQKKGKTGQVDEDDETEGEAGGVGIRVRLRSGRAFPVSLVVATVYAYLGIVFREETKISARPKDSGATIDIDSVWARLNRPKQQYTPAKPTEPSSELDNAAPSSEPTASKSLPAILKAPASEQSITIPHSYVFAGETHKSTKTVPISSPEAQAYLASKEKQPSATTGPPLRRPFARKGLLEPNPSFLIKGREVPPRADLPISIGGKGTRHLDANKKATQWEVSKDKKAKKLNTVEKSKLDWEAEVERQGIREELEKASKSGNSYLGRREFLDRVEGKGEEEARQFRLKQAGIAG
ncbi:swr complex subunit [Lecanora helva]